MCIFALLFHFTMIVSPYLQVLVFDICYFITIALNTIAFMVKNCLFGIVFERPEMQFKFQEHAYEHKWAQTYFSFKLREDILNLGSQQICKML